ncbi:MAG: lysophospholipid acyltransferase family protein [Alphaproteobacteria bacterium]|nr:lysophospholipid acyltransferase family protein [Alphaproteobacteria bacterium]
MALRDIFKQDWVRRAGCFIAANYIRLVYATSRFEVINGATPQRYWDEGQPFILAFWHGRIAMMPYSWRRAVPMNMLISKHRDGELIADTIAYFGLKSVRGSASKPGKDKDKGGQAALMAMIRALRSGECVGITPDGPRGPRMRASGGAAALARLSGVPVIPAAYSTRRRRVLSSWDRFVLPLPFTRGVFVWGEPIHVDRKADEAALDAARLAIEDGLNRVSGMADELAGQEVIAPAPLPLPAERQS